MKKKNREGNMLTVEQALNLMDRLGYSESEYLIYKVPDSEYEIFIEKIMELNPRCAYNIANKRFGDLKKEKRREAILEKARRNFSERNPKRAFSVSLGYTIEGVEVGWAGIEGFDEKLCKLSLENILTQDPEAAFYLVQNNKLKEIDCCCNKIGRKIYEEFILKSGEALFEQNPDKTVEIYSIMKMEDYPTEEYSKFLNQIRKSFVKKFPKIALRTGMNLHEEGWSKEGIRLLKEIAFLTNICPEQAFQAAKWINDGELLEKNREAFAQSNPELAYFNGCDFKYTHDRELKELAIKYFAKKDPLRAIYIGEEREDVELVKAALRNGGYFENTKKFYEFGQNMKDKEILYQARMELVKETKPKESLEFAEEQDDEILKGFILDSVSRSLRINKKLVREIYR